MSQNQMNFTQLCELLSQEPLLNGFRFEEMDGEVIILTGLKEENGVLVPIEEEPE